jgi:GT2 family glycosyltransferase
MSEMKKIAVLMACHNRCATTLSCLRLLFGNVTDSKITVFLVDDGSTDGTCEAVKNGFPAVHTSRGTGSLYWAKGMELAWKMALEHEHVDGKFDDYMWLNDDAMLAEDALEKLMSKDDGQSIVVGNLVDENGKPVYGFNVNGWVNGNCVLIPRDVFEKVGMICGEYAHAWADSDYAMRAKRAGISITGCGVVGTTEWHPLRPDLGTMCLRERWNSLFNPKGWNLHDLWLYRKRNWGRCAAIASCVHFVIHVLVGK